MSEPSAELTGFGPFPGLSEEGRQLLRELTEDWRGGVDPDRDLWECRAEWPNLTLTGNTLRVTTGSVSLTRDDESVDFGPFVLNLTFYANRGGESLGFDIATVPVSPNRRGDYPHPHVNFNNVPCLGEAAELVYPACRQGRWGDAFTALLQMLQTYNPDSPYVGLYAWLQDGDECECCGEYAELVFGGMCQPCFNDHEDTCVCEICGEMMWDCDSYCVRSYIYCYADYLECPECEGCGNRYDSRRHDQCPVCPRDRPEDDDQEKENRHDPGLAEEILAALRESGASPTDVQRVLRRL